MIEIYRTGIEHPIYLPFYREETTDRIAVIVWFDYIVIVQENIQLVQFHIYFYSEYALSGKVEA